MSTYVYLNSELLSVFVLSEETPEAGELIGHMDEPSQSQNPNHELFLVQTLLRARGVAPSSVLIHKSWPPELPSQAKEPPAS